MRQRFNSATDVIQLNPNRIGAVCRFIKRSMISDPKRPGALEGAEAEFSWERVRFTLFEYPKVKRKHEEIMREFNHLNITKINSMSELNKHYKIWGLNF